MIACPGRVPRPARPDCLGDQLVRSFRGPLIGQVQGHVRRDDADERHGWDVDPLRDEAGPDQHVDPAVGEGVEDASRSAAALHHVPIQAGNPEPGKPVAHLALEALRAAAEVADPRRAATRAARSERRGATAVVAPKGDTRLVVDERPGALRAGLDVPAVAAQHDRRRAAPVDHEDGLVADAAVQRLDRGGKRPREHPADPGLQLRAQVHDLDRRREAGQPVGQPDSAVASRLGPGLLFRPPALPTRGRPQRRRARRAGSRHRVPGCGRPVALVRLIVLLVDDDQADGRERGECRQPRPDDHVHRAGSDAPPLVGTLAVSKAAVEERHRSVELRAEPVDEGERKCDLGNEQEPPAGLRRDTWPAPRHRSPSCRRP